MSAHESLLPLRELAHQETARLYLQALLRLLAANAEARNEIDRLRSQLAEERRKATVMEGALRRISWAPSNYRRVRETTLEALDALRRSE